MFFKFVKKLKKFSYNQFLINLLNKNKIKNNNRSLFTNFIFSNTLFNYFNFIIIIFKNLLRVFYRRYRTVILRKRISKILGTFRLNVLKWSLIEKNNIYTRFYLLLIFGSRYLF